MNKTERDRLLGYISKGRFFGRETTRDLDRLRDYVDTLESAAESAYDLLMEHFPPNDTTTVKLRKALAKGRVVTK